MSFEDFLQTQPKEPSAPDLVPPVAVDPFEAFLRKQGIQRQQQTLQDAQAATVVNSQQSASTAASAAPVSRQIGLPQAAVETDLPRYQAQAKAQQNADILSSNPVVARWVAANPDSARIAQDEYDKLALIEKTWEGTKSVALGNLKQLGGAFNQSALALNRALGVVAPEDWWQQHMIAPLVAGQEALKPEGALETYGGMPGGLAGVMSQVILSGGQGTELPATAGALTTIANATRNAIQQMWMPATTAAINTGSDVMQATGDKVLAAKAAATAYAGNTMMGMVPLSAPGTLLKRIVTGAGSNAVQSEANRAAMNLVLPQEMQKPFSLEEFTANALQGAVMGGVMGPRLEPNFRDAIRQTYIDASKAEQANQDIGKVAALGEIAAKSKLREADPAAFRNFVEMVTDRSNLDAVYVDPKLLTEALAQSKVNVNDMPEVAKQLADSALTKGDIRIPVSEYATHIAGTDLEKPLLQQMKSSPDGMTFTEGQKFYEQAAQEMDKRAQEVVKKQQAASELQTDKDAVYQKVYDQLTAIGRNPAEAKTNAILIAEYYGTMGPRAGIKPSEMMAQLPLRIGAEGIEGFAQNNASGESSASLEAQSRARQEQDAGQTRVLVNKDGTTRQLTGVDAVDQQAGAGQVILQRGIGKNEWTVLSQGDDVKQSGVARAISQAGSFAQEARGAYSPNTRTIALLKNADLSTFVHETGHFALDTMHQLSASSPEIKADLDSLLKWAGADPNKWGSMSLEEQRPYHEKVAQGFEQYLFEGKAPTAELQPVFSRIRSWMVNVYKSLRGLGVELTPEVRQVFDRMLASDDAIKAAEQQRSYSMLFKTAEEAGMTPAAFETYRQMGAKATDQAIGEMQAKSLKDMQWTSGAKGRALRELQVQGAKARKGIEAEVTKEVDQMPVFQALDYIKARSPEYKAQLDEWRANKEAVISQAKEATEAAKETARQSMKDWEAANPEPQKPKPSEVNIDPTAYRKRGAALKLLARCMNG